MLRRPKIWCDNCYSYMKDGTFFIYLKFYLQYLKLNIYIELECFGRKLCLSWHFRNEESITISNPFKKKSTFNPKGKDAAIELYLSRLEEEIMAINTKLSYSNLTKEERLALSLLRDGTSVIIKEADKGSGVVVWDRKDYLKEAEKQLGDKETYEELSSDPVSPLISIVKGCLSRVKKRGDIPNETLEYFFYKQT